MIYFDLSSMLFALSTALDVVENELLGATTNHSIRVAFMCMRIGQVLGMSSEKLIALTGCAVLHDSALTEYIHNDMQGDLNSPIDIAPHCVIGEEHASRLPFDSSYKNAVLYHHEQANGKGPFGKKGEEIPFFARLIHIADQLDVRFDYGRITPEKYEKTVSFVQENIGILFEQETAELFLRVIDYKVFCELSNENLEQKLFEGISSQKKLFSADELKEIATIFARIIDYKSPFTCNHSLGIAQKAEALGIFYGLDKEMCAKLFFAGAVHDVGKLVITNDILEKPDKLTNDEFVLIKNHAYVSYEILSKIIGLEDVAGWAYLHHEKLDGTGYPFGYDGSRLEKYERLMGCVDIYQALVEKRPYKDGFSHEKAIEILQSMAAQNKIDGSLVKDIDECFGKNA